MSAPAVDLTRARQQRASEPTANAWVSANAGSGKTYVLTLRVLRLLLRGVPPSRILCITFTKAAAANMATRIFDTLAKWTALPDSDLERAIRDTGATFDRALLRRARLLFSETIESPGGLKIQTIHGFCESILHLFPFEARVPANFTVIDEETRRELMRRAVAETFGVAADDDALRDAIGRLAADISEFTFEKLLADALPRYIAISAARRREDESVFDTTELARLLGLDPSDTRDSLSEKFINGEFDDATKREIAAMLDRGSTTDQKMADKFRSVVAGDIEERVAAYQSIYLTEKDEPRKSLVTKALQKLEPALLPRLEREQTRVIDVLDRLRAVGIRERTASLLRVVDGVADHYQRLKNAAAAMDFDDLIERTRSLLLRLDAQWVMYRLDAGVEHILVDEAQDTSPAQWAIIEALTREFTAGYGARQYQRTIFAVGDEKQSIYSFQGARPRLFDEYRRQFEQRSRQAERAFHYEKLQVSFRSSEGVLEAIDAVFADDANRKGLSSDSARLVHESFKTHLPALVEVWEPVVATDDAPPEDWRLPLDAARVTDPETILADRLATLCKELLAGAEDGERPVAAGDIMILLRRRGALFESIIRALKQKALPVAGADRIKLSESIAVMDLAALGHYCAQPGDDLSLACVLKSPLIGFDDDDLIAIAPERAGSLIDALRASPNPRHRDASERIDAWERAARDRAPFDFYASVLEAEGGRAAMIARLGAEAGDTIDEFMRLALDWSAANPPALIGFLRSLETSNVEIKRDMEAAPGAIRVMTVHASKGLEARVVMLPDTCRTPARQLESPLIELQAPNGETYLAWSARAKADCAAVAAARERERQESAGEYRRLLYVAMSRAEERLYIMGCHGAKGPDEGCWHNMVSRALEPLLTPSPAFWNAAENVRRLRREGREETPPSRSTVTDHGGQAFPDWLRTPVANLRAQRLRPSARTLASIEGSAAARENAARFGSMTHAVLRRLAAVAPAERDADVAAMLATRMSDEARAALEAACRQALRVLDAEALRPLFGPGSLAEFDIAGALDGAAEGATMMSGRIDRLAIHRDEVWFAEFKTGQGDESRRDSYLRQMALYASALARAYPRHAIVGFLVWTSGPRIERFTATELAPYAPASTAP